MECTPDFARPLSVRTARAHTAAMSIPLRAVPLIAPEPIELPHNLEAEAALLGALMLDNGLVVDVQMTLRPEHFYGGEASLHARLYAAILKLSERNMIATPVTLRPMFLADEAMKAQGGPTYLAELTHSAALIAAPDFARQIYDLALLRALVTVGREMATDALDTSQEIDPKAKIEAAEMALYKVAETGEVSGGVKSFVEAARMAVEMAARAKDSGGQISGITTGLTRLDATLGGLHPSDLVIVAGRPGMGKTALATNIAFAAAKRFLRDGERIGEGGAGARVAFFSLEMSADQLATRILAEQSEISSEDLRRGKIDQTEFRRLARAAAELETLPFYIDDTPGLSIAALRTRARRLKRQRGIGLVIVDYLQLMVGSARKSNENRVQEISEVTRGLKTLAKELSVPVIALSQLSRAVEQRENKRPVLADLRESGSIEQDADMVMFVFRDEYYHDLERPTQPGDNASSEVQREWDEWLNKKSDLSGRAEIIIAKQRHGPTGNVNVMFDAQYTKFSDVADESRMPERYR